MTTTTFRQAGFIFLPLLLFFMSCTVEESEREITDMRIPVVFNAPAVTLQTRTSVDGDRWIGGDRVGIYMLSTGGSLPADIVGDAGNRQYTVSSVNAVNAASLVPVNSNTDMIMYPPTGNVDFVACYPYQAAGTDGNGYYPVNVSNQNNPAAIDLMYARVTNVGKSSATVSLPFEHVMSRLVLNIRKGTGLVDSDFADITATMSGMPVKAGFSLSDRQFVPEGNLA
ncbi:MAG: fimbrillin family protein, partial [Tannerella sp.]|nr:fimbrillin family protein [Tannerella sp.]